MIKLISGATRIDSKLIRPADGAFSAPPDVERHLVASGVAVYVDDKPVVSAGAEPEQASGTVDTAETKTAKVTAAGLKRMSKANLLAIAEQKGLDATEDMTNSAIIDLILAEEGGEPEGGNDNEPPVTTPAQPE